MLSNSGDCILTYIKISLSDKTANGLIQIYILLLTPFDYN